MRALLLFSCVYFLMNGPLSAQTLAIEVPTGAPLKDIPVAIKMVVSGYRCEELTMKVNQGKLEPLGNCWYRYTGTQVGYGKFQVYARRKGRLALIDSVELLVKPLERPQAVVAGRAGGTISSGALAAQSGLSAIVPLGGDHWESLVTVVSYQVVIFRDSNMIGVFSGTDNRFTDAMKQRIRALQAGDRVAFVNIRGSDHQKTDVSIKPVEFVITE